MIAQALRSKGMEVYEGVTCLAEQDSIRRIDIITINRKKNVAEILDPTIRFEISKTQPSDVDREKKAIYEPTIPYFFGQIQYRKYMSDWIILRCSRYSHKILHQLARKI